jgi:hypothetical protein
MMGEEEEVVGMVVAAVVGEGLLLLALLRWRCWKLCNDELTTYWERDQACHQCYPFVCVNFFLNCISLQFQTLIELQ